MKITARFHHLLFVLLLWAGAAAHGAAVMVFGAASLTDSLREIGANYQKKTGVIVSFNFASSSLLARQIEAGAPADIFFSADEKWMDDIEKHGFIQPGTRRNCLSNSLVIVVPSDSTLPIHSPGDLASEKVAHLALGDPRAVPAGIYAREYLTKLRLWSKVEPKVVPMANVRAALAAVESGDAEAGIVYKTDAGISKRVRVAYEVPIRDGPPITYPMAEIKGLPDPEPARKFLEYLASPEAGRVFARYGFIIDATAHDRQ